MLRKYIIFLLLVFMVLVIGCLEEEVGFFLKLGEVLIIIILSGGNSFVLNEDDQNNILIVFIWIGVDFGYNVGIDYDL